MNTVSNSWLRINPAVLHTSVRRIHRGKEARGPEKLQRIDYEIKRGRHKNDESAHTKKPDQIPGWRAHQNLK
jgi:hypothetical protein